MKIERIKRLRRGPAALIHKGGMGKMNKENNKICRGVGESRVVLVDGKVIIMCREHEQQARNLCNAMGWPLTIINITDLDQKCEAKVK